MHRCGFSMKVVFWKDGTSTPIAIGAQCPKIEDWKNEMIKRYSK